MPTPRREPTVRSEDLSGEIQGESGESQTAEPTDYAEARADFWSIQGDFINRHHNEPRLQLHVPKEETFPFSLKYIDVARSTHSDLGVLQEKRIDDYWNVGSRKHLSRIWRGFTKFTIEREASKRIHVVWGETDKDPNDYQTRKYGQKYGRKLAKPLRIEKNKNGQKKNRNLTMLEN